MPKQKDYFKPFRKAATGLGGLGITTAVTAGIATNSPAGSSLTREFSTLAGYTPIAVTAVGGKTVLNIIKPKKRRKQK